MKCEVKNGDAVHFINMIYCIFSVQLFISKFIEINICIVPVSTLKRKYQYVYIIDQARGQDGWVLAEFSFCVFIIKTQKKLFEKYCLRNIVCESCLQEDHAIEFATLVYRNG